MLPGFRFLFAAIVLSLSILVFGLGAAALLRAAHEEFASMPSRRAPPEPVFAQQNEAPLPMLALLRAEPSIAEKAPDTIAAAVVPEAVAPSEPARDAAPAEPEKLAALKPDDSAPAEAAKPEAPATEATPAPATQAVPAQADVPASIEEPKLAAIAETPPPVNEAAPVPAAEAPSLETPALEVNAAATKIATLGGPAVTIEPTASAKTTDAKPDRSAVRRRVRAQRASERRRLARRARQAVSQQPGDPFSQPAATVRSR
jgi:hypothetical protein